MKILFSGWHNPHFTGMAEFIERALERCGHQCIPFEYRQYLLPGRLRDRVPFLERMDLRRINRKLAAAARAQRPDLLFILQGDTILPETVASLRRSSGIPAINWFIDPEPRIRALARRVAQTYDLFFAGYSTMVEELQKAGSGNVRLLHYACDPELQQPVPLTEDERRRYAHDIVFLGSWYPERETLLNALSDLDLGVWGAGWDNLAPSSPVRRRVFGGQMQPQEWRKIYSAAKIVLNAHYGFGKEPRIEQANNRVFEALGCGAFLLTDDTADVRSLFRDGEHLAAFRTAGELKEKIRWYLDHPGQRSLIALEGRKEVLAHHTYDHRVREIFSLLALSRGT